MEKKRHKDRSDKYLHGYSKKEQQRLYTQAELLKPFVYAGVDLSRARNLLEVGSGVGAQTAILLQSFPQLHITCVEISDVQIQAAKKHLTDLKLMDRVTFFCQNAENLKSLPGGFDSAFICWFLEHVPRPQKVLAEIHAQLLPGSPLYCSEVLNASLFVHPYSPAVLKYWFQFNDYEWLLKGNPFVGAQLGNLLLHSGFHKIATEVRPLHFDSRDPAQRKVFIHEFRDLLLSAYPGLVRKRKVTPALVKRVQKELTTLSHSKDSVIFQVWIRALAYA